MTSDLRDILSGDDAADTPEVAEVATPETPVAETGVNEEVGDTPAAVVTPTPEPEKEKSVPLAALMAEREKRQRLEEQLKAAAPKPAVPDFFADPETHVKTAIQENTARMSAAMVEQQFPDFRERLTVFLEEAKNNPILQAELEAHPHPALFAYNKAKEIEDYRQMKDLPAYKERLRAEIKAELLADMTKQGTDKAALVASLPPDLSGARGARAPAAEDLINEPLESILK